MSEDRTAAGGRDWNDPREVEDPEIDAQNKAFVSATRKLPCVEVKHRALLAIDALDVDYGWNHDLLTQARELVNEAWSEACKRYAGKA